MAARVLFRDLGKVEPRLVSSRVDRAAAPDEGVVEELDAVAVCGEEEVRGVLPQQGVADPTHDVKVTAANDDSCIEVESVVDDSVDAEGATLRRRRPAMNVAGGDTMRRSGFAQFMRARGAEEREVERVLVLADRFEEFCRAEAGVSASEATIELATAFSATLLSESVDPIHDLRALSGYARFLGSKAARVVFQGALAGQTAFGGVRKKVEVELGERECDELLAGIQIPPLGASGLERAHAMHLLVDRLELALGREKAAALIS